MYVHHGWPRRGDTEHVAQLLASLVCINAVSTMPRPEEFSRLWVQPLPNCFKLLPRHFSTQTQQLRAASKPFTLNATAFIVVVAVFQVRWA